MSLTREFAGAQRVFRLRYGDMIDLEEACGKTGIGAIYKRLAAFDWRAADVLHILRLGLVGGGMEPEEARRLVSARIDAGPMAALVSLALEIMLATVEGAPEPKAAPAHNDKPIDKGKVFHDFAQLGISPQQVREMRFSDVLHLYEAAGRTAADAAPSEAEFAAMMRRLDDPGMAWASRPQ